MAFQYIVPLPPFPTKQLRHWVWWLTVILRVNGRCQHCHRERRLDAAHIQPRRTRPDLQFDPDNGIALCRSCHLKHDHAHGHRPSGRPKGFPHKESTKILIGLKTKAFYNRPEIKAELSIRSKAHWDKRGRKRHAIICAYHACEKSFDGIDRQYCSPACHYADVRAGKRGLKTGPTKGYKWPADLIARRAATRRSRNRQAHLLPS